MRATGKSKTTVWRWQERFATDGIDGLLSDATRPPGKAPISPERVDQHIRLTQEDPPHQPAVLNGTTILTGRTVPPDLADRIADARSRGLAQAGEDALVGTVTAAYDLLRFSYLGYRRFFGIITEEEEA